MQEGHACRAAPARPCQALPGLALGSDRGVVTRREGGGGAAGPEVAGRGDGSAGVGAACREVPVWKRSASRSCFALPALMRDAFSQHGAERAEELFGRL
jgi:hypothetical protein